MPRADIRPYKDNKPEESSPPPMLDPESQKKQEDSCSEEYNLILADLEYVYLNGQKNLVDRLFIFDEKLYRPDGAGMDYYPDTQNQIQAQYIHELHLTDPNLPNGQKATGGNMSIRYDKENPKKYELPLAGISEPFLAGEINAIILNLDGKTYSMKKKIKEINNITLLNITRPTLTPTPTLSFSSDADAGYKKYTNIKHGFSLIYPDNLRYEEMPTNDDKYLSLYFYLKDSQDNTKYEYYLAKNITNGWGSPSKDINLQQINVDGQTVDVKN